MQFIDRTRVIVKAGDGGHGKSAFRREKFIPKGVRPAAMAAAAAISSLSLTRI